MTDRSHTGSRLASDVLISPFQLGPDPDRRPGWRPEQLRQLGRHTLSGERVGVGVRLFIFRSPAPIFRLPGHSQREDRLAKEVLTFFGRVIPHLWTADTERRISSASPLEVYAAFLLHTRARIARSQALRDALGGAAASLGREFAAINENNRDHLDAGKRLLAALGELPIDTA